MSYHRGHGSEFYHSFSARCRSSPSLSDGLLISSLTVIVPNFVVDLEGGGLFVTYNATLNLDKKKANKLDLDWTCQNDVMPLSSESD